MDLKTIIKELKNYQIENVFNNEYVCTFLRNGYFYTEFKNEENDLLTLHNKFYSIEDMAAFIYKNYDFLNDFDHMVHLYNKQIGHMMYQLTINKQSNNCYLSKFKIDNNNDTMSLISSLKEKFDIEKFEQDRYLNLFLNFIQIERNKDE